MTAQPIASPSRDLAFTPEPQKIDPNAPRTQLSNERAHANFDGDDQRLNTPAGAASEIDDDEIACFGDDFAEDGPPFALVGLVMLACLGTFLAGAVMTIAVMLR